MRVGIAYHLGWAVAVTASADHKVVDRPRLQLIEPGVPAPLARRLPDDIAIQRCVPYEARADSVRAGLAEVPADAIAVLVHDAARPLVSDAVIERVLAPLSEGWDGVVPGLPVADTLKRVDGDGRVLDTVERDAVYAVQTPQAFPADVLRRALAGDSSATDCAGSVEAAGGRVKVVPGDPRLLKVTTSEDLARVASWL